jgi:hypothetical protein
MASESDHRRALSELPLWRLLVALHDAEQTTGAGSATTRVIARAVQARLQRPDDGRPLGKSREVPGDQTDF